MQIIQTDFERPLSVGLGPKARILTLDVSKKSDKSLNPVARPKRGGIFVIEPLLLNGGDSFTLKVIVSQYDPEKFEIDGRIAGVQKIREPSQSSLQNWTMLALGVVFAIVGFVVAYQTSPPPPVQIHDFNTYIAFFVVGTIGEGLALIGVMRFGLMKRLHGD